MITLTPASSDEVIELHACLTRCYESNSSVQTIPDVRLDKSTGRWSDPSELPKANKRVQYHRHPRHHAQWLRDRKLHKPTDFNRVLRYNSIV